MRLFPEACRRVRNGAHREESPGTGDDPVLTESWLVREEGEKAPREELVSKACQTSHESAQGQRMNKLRPCKDFGQEVGIHHAADHLAALTVFYRMPFE